MKTWKDVILLLSGSQGILLALALIISSIRKRKANIFLALILIVCSVELLNVWVMSFSYHSRPNAFPFWTFGSYLLLPSSLWVFLLYNTDASFSFQKRHLIFFIPAIIEIITEFAANYIRRKAHTSFEFFNSLPWFLLTELLPIVWMIGVLIQYGFLLRKSARQGTLNQVHLSKQYIFLVSFSAFTFLWVGDVVFQFAVYSIIEWMLCAFLFGLGYVVYFQPGFFETPLVSKSKGEDLFATYNDDETLQRLKNLLENEKMYLTPRLAVDDVAERLNLPSRYISFLINKKFQSNFNAFVNGYRIKEVLERLNDPRENHKTIVGIALDSGFNSKSSFNQIFKTITGQTPSEYLSKNKK